MTPQAIFWPGSSVGLGRVTLLRKLLPTLLTVAMTERYSCSLDAGKTSSKFSLPQNKAPDNSFWEDVSARGRERGPKRVSKLGRREQGESQSCQKGEEEGAAGLKANIWPHPRPRPPSCPQSHNELKQQCELLRFRRQKSPWQPDSSCRQTASIH